MYIYIYVYVHDYLYVYVYLYKHRLWTMRFYMYMYIYMYVCTSRYIYSQLPASDHDPPHSVLHIFMSIHPYIQMHVYNHQLRTGACL